MLIIFMFCLSVVILTILFFVLQQIKLWIYLMYCIAGLFVTVLFIAMLFKIMDIDLFLLIKNIRL